MLCAAMLCANPAAAQSVRIQNGLGEWGFGWMFRHSGACHVAMPRHVARPDDAPFAFPKVTVWSAAPVASDGATVSDPFWEGLDLATAVIDAGPLDDRCTATLADLAPTEAARRAERAVLVRLTATGEERRVPIRVLDRGYLEFTGELLGDGAAIAQGTSGAFAFAGDRPIGMAVTSDDAGRARFVRSEEIALNLGRFLAERGHVFSRADPTAIPVAGEGLPVRSVEASAAPLLPQHGAENMLGEGLFVARPAGPLVITLRLDGEDAFAVRRIQMTSPAEGHAVPRNVAIHLDAGAEGRRFRIWTQVQMRPDGTLDTGPLAARNARWVRLVVRDAWSEGPVAIDRVVIK